MHDDPYMLEDEYIIWNPTLGIRDFVTIERIEGEAEGRVGWLDAPYDMVGPFSVDALERSGRIGFAECFVMSRQRWREDQAELRREAFEAQRKAREKIYEELHRANRRKRAGHGAGEERSHRELLCLPVEGMLEVAQVKAAFRRAARTAHPDVGGSHEHFVRIADARDALLERLF